MECPICFSEYDSNERRPLRAFCACNKTICVSCVESMLKNAAFCPWDKTRWIGRNLMAKFQSNTPANYLKILLKQAVDNQTAEILDQIPKTVELGAGELRSEYLRQQRLEQERFQAEQEAIIRKDEELAAEMENEAQERAAMLLKIEQEDMKLALSLVNDQPLLQTANASPSMNGLVHNKNTIVHSINKQLVEKIKHAEIMDLSQSPITALRQSVSSASKTNSTTSNDSDWISARSGSSSSVPSSSSSKQSDIKNHFTVTDKNDMSLFANRTTFASSILSQSSSSGGSSSSSSGAKKTGTSGLNSSVKDPSQFFQRRSSSGSVLSSDVASGSQNIAPNNSESRLSGGIAAHKRPRVIEAIELLSDDSDTSQLAPPTTKTRPSNLRIHDEEDENESGVSKVENVPWFCSGCTFRNGVGTTFCRMCKADRVVV